MYKINASIRSFQEFEKKSNYTLNVLHVLGEEPLNSRNKFFETKSAVRGVAERIRRKRQAGNKYLWEWEQLFVDGVVDHILTYTAGALCSVGPPQVHASDPHVISRGTAPDDS